MPPADRFELLSGPEGQTTPVLRHGDTVLRPAGPWTPAVHALLIHLENAGFTGSPRVIGNGYDGHGREVLTYIPGDTVDPHAWMTTSPNARTCPTPPPAPPNCATSWTATNWPPPIALTS